MAFFKTFETSFFEILAFWLWYCFKMTFIRLWGCNYLFDIADNITFKKGYAFSLLNRHLRYCWSVFLIDLVGGWNLSSTCKRCLKKSSFEALELSLVDEIICISNVAIENLSSNLVNKIWIIYRFFTDRQS